jgi:hypothetical protein
MSAMMPRLRVLAALAQVRGFSERILVVPPWVRPPEVFAQENEAVSKLRYHELVGAQGEMSKENSACGRAERTASWMRPITRRAESKGRGLSFWLPAWKYW